MPVAFDAILSLILAVLKAVGTGIVAVSSASLRVFEAILSGILNVTVFAGEAIGSGCLR